MTNDLKIARDYLIRPPNAFWNWADNGEVISWTDERLIVFREELRLVLGHLAPKGLPKLSQLLLVLAATNDSWGRAPYPSSVLVASLKIGVDHSFVDIEHPSVSRVIDQLGRIRELDSDLRKTPAAKALLAEVVFESFKDRTTSEEAATILGYLNHGIQEVLLELPEQQSPKDDLADDGPGMGKINTQLSDILDLQKGLGQVNAESLRLRRETGLDSLPIMAELELPAAESIRELLGQLEHDAELGGLARLALNLMAAVALPRAVADFEELQVGGVSDITNRGPVDRLLLSELAHDGFMLAVRVAMNEALYLRRESPPKSPPRQLALLLDTGIRSWGIPRVYLTALALALAATSEQGVELLAFRAQGEDVVPVDLTTRAGLMSHLSALDTAYHPGGAWPAFEREIAKSENPAEPVLLTTDDVDCDQEFRRALEARNIAAMHLAAVNREGRLQLYEITAGGRKKTREAKLDLTCLLSRSESIQASKIAAPADLPAIFSVKPFPLLLPHNIHPERSWLVKKRGLLCLTSDRRLMFWGDVNRGALQIATDIRGGKLWWSSSTPIDDRVHAIVGQDDDQGLSLLTIDLQRFECESQRLDRGRGVTGVCAHNGGKFVIDADRVRLLGAHGETLQTLSLPEGMQLHQGRFFFQHPDRWYALSFDGRTAHLELVVDERSKPQFDLVGMFEREGVDGPIGVTERGELYYSATGEIRTPKHQKRAPIALRGASVDGGTIVLATLDAQVTTRPRLAVLVDVDTLAVHQYRPQNPDVGSFRAYARPVNTRHRFTHAYVGDDDQITLISPKGNHVAINFYTTLEQMRLREVGGDGINQTRYSFKPVKGDFDFGFRLSSAKWSEGGEIFLDARGILHLRSSDGSLPQVSIVLTNHFELSGWCSDGRIFGHSYYVGESSRASQRSVYESVIKPFAERLR